MKHRLPRGQEWVLLAGLSIFCTLIVCLSSQRDAVLAMLAVPLFVVAALMGLRRSNEVTPAPQKAEEAAVPDERG